MAAQRQAAGSGAILQPEWLVSTPVCSYEAVSVVALQGMIAAVSEMRSAGACTNGVRCELAALAQMSNTCRSLGACGLLLETRFVLTGTAADWRDAADRRRLGSREASSPRLSNVNSAASGRAVKLCLTARSTAASLNAASVARFASRRRFLRETREDSAIVRVCAVLTVAQNWLDAALPCLPRSSRFFKVRFAQTTVVAAFV